MIASRLIGADARCAGERIGYVGDLRIELDANRTADELSVVGVVVSARMHSTFLGYERTAMRGPWMIDRLLRYLNRDSVLVDWADIEGFDEQSRTLEMRKGFRRLDVALPNGRSR